MCVFRQWYFETRNLGAAEVPSNVCSGQSITRSSWSPEVTIGLPGSDLPRSIFHFLCSIVVKHSFYYPPFFLKLGTLPLLFVVRSSDLLLLMYIYITVRLGGILTQHAGHPYRPHHAICSPPETSTMTPLLTRTSYVPRRRPNRCLSVLCKSPSLHSLSMNFCSRQLGRLPVLITSRMVWELSRSTIPTTVWPRLKTP